MSGTQNPPIETNPLTATERTDVRRFCGYGAAGLLNSFSNYRFFQIDGLLEYRMTNLSDSDCVAARLYLNQCNAIETALFAVGAGGEGDTLVADAAASYKHNKNEIDDRTKLLDAVRSKLCNLLAVPTGPYFGSSGTIRLYN